MKSILITYLGDGMGQLTFPNKALKCSTDNWSDECPYLEYCACADERAFNERNPPLPVLNSDTLVVGQEYEANIVEQACSVELIGTTGKYFELNGVYKETWVDCSKEAIDVFTSKACIDVLGPIKTRRSYALIEKQQVEDNTAGMAEVTGVVTHLPTYISPLKQPQNVNNFVMGLDVPSDTVQGETVEAYASRVANERIGDHEEFTTGFEYGIHIGANWQQAQMLNRITEVLTEHSVDGAMKPMRVSYLIKQLNNK